jgi:hypothetical protein
MPIKAFGVPQLAGLMVPDCLGEQLVDIACRDIHDVLAFAARTGAANEAQPVSHVRQRGVRGGC